MAEIVNLRTARKARDRRVAQEAAAANRARFGRTRAEKTATEAEAARIERTVDGARIERADTAPKDMT